MSANNFKIILILGDRFMSQTMEFKTEVSKLLDIVIHSLYSNKDIFLRELISNASDAIDKIRYEGLTDQSKYENDTDWKIKLTPNKAAGTLTISDNGIGMDYDEVINTLGTIANSGTKEFMKMLEEKNAKDAVELIGQFGVGFYSAFMVADKVTVITRKAGQEKGVKWESEAAGTFEIGEALRANRGTDIILHLKEDDKKYLDEWTLRDLVSKYSDYIEHPIVMDIERPKKDEEGKPLEEKEIKEEVLNSRKAIWLRNKSEITQEEYNDFYKHITHDYSDPLKTIHFKVEGTHEFAGLLYIPKMKPFDIIYKEYKSGPMLYVKRVQIMEHCEELFPPYLRFVKGVVESNDLPLNISREILQNNRLIEVMRKNITKRVLDALTEMKNKEYDTYVSFYKEFGRILKEGLHFEYDKKENIADLVLAESTATEDGKYTTFADYVSRMKEGQNDIYYILSASRAEAMASPYMEGLTNKGYEVLILTDDIDDIVISALGEYKGKQFKSVVKGDINLTDEEKAAKEKKTEELSSILGFIKEQLKDKVADVRLSSRLTDSPVCLVRGETDFDPHIEQIMKAMGQAYMAAKRTMEINAEHPLFVKLNEVYNADKENPVLKEYVDLLYDEALILEGAKPVDAGLFAKRVASLMLKGLE